MYRIFLKNILISFSVFVLVTSFSYAQEKSLDDLIRDLKRGSSIEKITAAKSIVIYGEEAKKAVRSLKKLVRSEKDPKKAVIYLNALLAVSDDDNDAYKRYLKNGLKQKGKKREKAKKIKTFFEELGNSEAVQDSDIAFVKTLRSNKKVSNYIVTNILSSMANNNPEKLSIILGDFDQLPADNLRILAKLESGVDAYLPNIKAVMVKSPLLALDLLVKIDAIDQDVIDFAITKAVKPKAKSNSFYLSDRRTTYNAAIDVLVKAEGTNPAAREKLSILTNGEGWKDVAKSIRKFPDISPELKVTINNSVYSQLERPKTPQNGVKNLDYDICMDISSMITTDPQHIKILLKKVRLTPEAIVKMSCTYAIRSIEVPDAEVVSYLESLLYDNVSAVSKSVGKLLTSTNSAMNEMTTVQFNRRMAPGFLPLYAAHVLLEKNPNHVVAKSIAEKYYNANLKLLKFDRDKLVMRSSNPNIAFPSAMSNDGTFKAAFSESSPFEVFALATSNDENALLAHIEAGLKSDNKARAINAARYIVENGLNISIGIQLALIEKVSSDENKLLSEIFIKALKFANHNEQTINVLKSLAAETYVPRKNAAMDVLKAINKD
ncbi:MAG: hypothetical protein JKY84_01315 [Emcibacteraceae bacterium]|nr:hypothetical protein [Emcibacteraceae bacterium]